MIELTSKDTDTVFIKIVKSNNFKQDVTNIKSINGRRYDSETKLWTIPSTELDEFVKLYNNGEILWNMPNPYTNGKPTHIAKFDINNEYLDELKLTPYDFQIIGASFLSQIKKGLLGDEMGLGNAMGYVKLQLTILRFYGILIL